MSQTGGMNSALKIPLKDEKFALVTYNTNGEDEWSISFYNKDEDFDNKSFCTLDKDELLDYILKILKKQSEGLKAWQKMVLLLIVSGAFAYYSYVNLPHYIAIPFTNMELPLGVLYIPFVIFVYASMTNAVNLTDGLDGLASTVSVLVLTFFAVLTFTLKDYSLTVFSVALIAGLLGFLKYNAYPAKVFMGDTGSLAIGGAITTIAIISGNPLIIVLVGGIYVCEALSVIIQVTSFKLTGKRVFKMAPIHHHFEQCGWNEVKIVTVFSIITVLLCIIGFFAI